MHLVNIECEISSLAFSMEQDAQSIENEAGGHTVRSLHLRCYVSQLRLMAAEVREACAGAIPADLFADIMAEQRREIVEVQVLPLAS